jgi:hypothetical protein
VPPIELGRPLDLVSREQLADNLLSLMGCSFCIGVEEELVVVAADRHTIAELLAGVPLDVAGMQSREKPTGMARLVQAHSHPPVLSHHGMLTGKVFGSDESSQHSRD